MASRAAVAITDRDRKAHDRTDPPSRKDDQHSGHAGMSAAWPRISLRQAGVALIDCEHRTPPEATSGYPYVAIPQIRQGRIDLSEVRRISREHFAEWTRKARPAPHDVVLSRRCNPGETAFVPPGLECALGQNLVLLRADGTKVFPPFLRWLVRGPVWWEQVGRFINVGAVFDSLKCADIPGFELPIPPIGEQRAIAHILGTLDDKIELNRRMSATLEVTTRATFQSWFVDFDPVRAKAEGRDTGLPRELADVFPDRFEDSALGDIPAGWPVAPLETHFDALKGVSYKGSGLSSAGMPLHNLNSVREGGGYKHEGIKYYVAEFAERHRVRPGDVIVANTEQGHDRLLIGYAARVPAYMGSEGIASHHVYRMRPRHESWLTTSFLCWMLNSRQMHDLVSGFANGTTVNMLPIDGVQKPQFVVPPRPIVAAFDRVATGADGRCQEIVRESRSLAALRDTLLPKLISGELRVRDAERFLSQAGV